MRRVDIIDFLSRKPSDGSMSDGRVVHAHPFRRYTPRSFPPCPTLYQGALPLSQRTYVVKKHPIPLLHHPRFGPMSTVRRRPVHSTGLLAVRRSTCHNAFVLLKVRRLFQIEGTRAVGIEGSISENDTPAPRVRASSISIISSNLSRVFSDSQTS